MTDTDTTEAELEAQIGAYAERIFQTGLASLEAITISLGRELGLYDHLATEGGVTPDELAQRAGIDGRYAREWLEQQAIRRAHRGDRAEHRRRSAPLRPVAGRAGMPAATGEPRLGRTTDRPHPRRRSGLPDRPRRCLPKRPRHPLRRPRIARRPGRLQPPRVLEPPRVGLAAIDPRPHRPARRRPGASRRDRLRRRMGRDQSGQGLARHRGRRVRQRRSLDRGGPQACRRGRCRRPCSLRGRRCHPRPARPSGPSQLRPRDGLRDGPRPRPPRRSTGHHAPTRQARRHRPRRRREGGLRVRRPRATTPSNGFSTPPACCTACPSAGPNRPPRPLAPSCGRRPSPPTPRRPVSPPSRSCRSNTTSCGSISSSPQSEWDVPTTTTEHSSHPSRERGHEPEPASTRDPAGFHPTRRNLRRQVTRADQRPHGHG